MQQGIRKPYVAPAVTRLSESEVASLDPVILERLQQSKGK